MWSVLTLKHFTSRQVGDAVFIICLQFAIKKLGKEEEEEEGDWKKTKQQLWANTYAENLQIFQFAICNQF